MAWCHAMPFQATPHHFTLWHTMSCYATPHYVTLCHITSCHVESCHTTSCHFTSCHVMSCHVMKFQTRTARLITSSYPFTSRISMFRELGWLSKQHRRDFHKCIKLYKSRNYIVQQYLCDLFNYNDICIPTIPEILISFKPQNHTLPTITIVPQYLVWTCENIQESNSVNFYNCITYVYWF